MIGLYLHIPFCRVKCPYCDFYSLPFSEELADGYTAALIRAIKSHPFGPLQADTLYLGGGTPSLLGKRRLTAILDAAVRSFDLGADSEITLEVNPESAALPLLRDLRRAGYNRLSVGLQSGSQAELAALGRTHTPEQACGAILAGAEAGFENISADLMLATPGQNEQSLARSIRMLTELPVTHLSAYLLKLEPGRALAGQGLDLPGEDQTADLYLGCVDQLGGAGFAQYEISNFARPDRESRHNLKYWRRSPYLGLGPAAHSFLSPAGREAARFFFPPDLGAFLAAEDPFRLLEYDPPPSAWQEEVLLRLRLTEGIDTAILREWELDPAPLLKKAGELAAHGLCRVEDGVASLTPKGFLLSNPITVSLLDALEPPVDL